MVLRVTEPRLDLVSAYRRMLTIRRFEERVLELRLTDEVVGLGAPLRRAGGDPGRCAGGARARGPGARDLSRSRLGARLRDPVS